MNVNFLNPFVEAAAEVLFAEANWQTKRGELQLEKSPYVTDDATVILSLIGDVEGIVLYSFPENLAIFLASAILGEGIAEFDNLAQSGIAELGNVITGRASIKLSKNGLHANISPPTLLLGRGGKISTLDVARIKVPLTGSKGVLTIHLALREGKKKGMTTPEIGVPNAPSI
jgi:chemotaxis protein CheX